jgi:nonsense-mediated mRNA decay protein 3
MLCVECGAETEPGPLCRDCELNKRRRPSVPEFVDIVVCGGCGAVLSGGTWKDVEMEDAVAGVISASLAKKVDLVGVKVALEEEDGNVYFAKVVVRSRAAGSIQRDELFCRLRTQSGTCETCGRLSGNYFESIVQVRAEGRLPSAEELEDCHTFIEKRVGSARATDRTVFMSKAEEVKGGLDVYLSSNQLGGAIARELAERTGARYDSSKELFGQKDGREIYRMTFLVRLPPYWPGAYVVVGERVARVRGLAAKRTMLTWLDTWEEEGIPTRELVNVRVLGGDELVKEAVVLAETETEVQLLDPETNKVVDVVKPRGWGQRGETARFIKHDEGAYLV